jgi:hypothetical protein
VSKPIMRSVTMPQVLSAIAVLVAAGLVVVLRGPDTGDESSVAPTEPAPTTTPAPSVAAPVSSHDTRAADKLRELNAMSQTFRNTTFLIAIREAGFVCNELFRVSGGLDDSPKWLATCSETLAYMISVASDGELHVEPFEQYFDGVGVRQIEQVLPPEPAPQPR